MLTTGFCFPVCFLLALTEIVNMRDRESLKTMSSQLQAEKKKETIVGNRLRRLLKPSSLVLILAWVALFGLLFYVQRFAKELSPFDPFDILKVSQFTIGQEQRGENEYYLIPLYCYCIAQDTVSRDNASKYNL